MNRAEYRRRRQHYLSLRLQAQIKALSAVSAVSSVSRSNSASHSGATGSIFDIQEREQQEACDAAYQALREELKTYRLEEDMAAMEREIINHQLVQSGSLLGEEHKVSRLPRLRYGEGI